MVLDPYMGSGSTGLAAVLSGRSFVGIDISEHYVSIAQRRFEEQIASGAWSGELSVQVEPDTKDMAGSSVQAVK